jgi:hypothetical protein
MDLDPSLGTDVLPAVLLAGDGGRDQRDEQRGRECQDETQLLLPMFLSAPLRQVP